MCIFTHFAAGALAGAATGDPWAAVAAGLASHALLDLFPHYDFEDWRREVGIGLIPLAVLVLTPLASLPALLGGLAGCLPDLENLLWKLGRMEKRRMVFPTHTGLLPHGPARGPRNLWVQAALAVACLAALPLVAPAAATAAPADPSPVVSNDAAPPAGAPLAVFARPQVRLLAADENGTRFEVRFPLAREPQDWGAVTDDRIAWFEPGPVVRTADGGLQALPPRESSLIAVPSDAAPAVVDVEADWWREPAVPVSPEQLVQVEGPAVFRDVPLATVAVLPGAGGAGVLARVVVTLAHPPAGAPVAALVAARRAGATPRLAAGADDPYGAAGVLNAALARDLAAGALLRDAAARARDVAHPFGLTPNWVRLEVQAAGVHRLTGNDLSLLGVSPAQVGSATLRIFRGGGLPQSADPTAVGSWMEGWTGLEEVALDVRDDDGTWDVADALLFYGVAGDAWRDRYQAGAGRLDWFQHPGTANGVYWLTWAAPGAASPLPGAPRRVAPATPATALGGQPVATHLARLHAEESYEDALGRLADNWAWDTRIRTSRSVTFNAGAVVAGEPALLVVDVRGYSVRLTSDAMVNQASAWLNADTGHPGAASWTVGQENDSLRVRLVTTSTALVSGTNTVTVRNERGTTGGIDLMLDSFDLLYRAPLAKTAAAFGFTHWGSEVAAPATPVDLTVTLPDAQAVTAWDVSDPLAPVALAGDLASGAAPALTLGVSRDPGVDLHLLVFDEGDPVTPPVRARRYPVDLRATMPAVDYVVIHDPTMATAASELAALRSARLPGVASPAAATVSEETVYDNFSGGRKDPWALRNFLKWLYLRDPDAANGATGRRLKYVALLGDASRDYRNHLDHQPTTQIYDFLPTPLRSYHPHRPYDSSYQYYPYASDDALACFDAPAFGFTAEVPDLAVGRLPARGAAEALAMVRRVRDATLAPESGLWRNRIALVADDLFHPPDDYYETTHTTQAERLANEFVPSTIDLQKIYLVDYPNPPGSLYKPAARVATRRAVSDGLTMVHYIGHGSENSLADEQVFLTEDIATLGNGMRRGVFLAFSCDVGVFDNPQAQSMGETFVAQEGGGAIAAVAASQVSFIYSNDLLSSALYRELFPDRRVVDTRSLGWAMLLAKRTLPGSFAISNSQRYHVFGDPAYRPPNPVTALDLTTAGVDTLRAGGRVTLAASLAGSGAAPEDGLTYDLRIEESRYEKSVPITNDTRMTWSLPGAVAFRGQGPVTSDPQPISLRVPLQLHYGPRGRVRLIVETPDGPVAGALELPVAAGGGGGASDVAGPAIALAFPDGRYRVPPGATLRGTVVDTSGVSVLGTTPSNSVLFELDDSGLYNDVSEAFAFDSGSFTSGGVDITLPSDLASGPHRLALLASDVLGNVGSDTLSFQVVPAGVAGFAGVTVFPNPTPGACRLVFELSDPMRVSWEVYSVGGRRVWSHDEEFPTAGPKVLHWDGRDGEGDAIANGVYLFVLRGNGAGDGAREVRETGRIVMMK